MENDLQKTKIFLVKKLQETKNTNLENNDK